ncbi:hypothetical protein WG954_16835 [Lacibacter sp. H375]|uniref:hypothetical protein n=1 Tax=Lacibacter sp. H375 TaxID=3133424 RepID=UPI0030C4C7B8
MKKITFLILSVVILKSALSQIKENTKTYYAFLSFGKKSEIQITKDSIIRKGINLSNDSLCVCTRYKIYKSYNINSYKFFVVSSYYNDENSYEIISFQKKQNVFSKVAFTEVLAWDYNTFPKKKTIRKRYLDQTILPYSQLFTSTEITKIESYTLLQNASTAQVLNTLDTLIHFKKKWLEWENKNPNVGKLGIHFYTEYISQALISNQINPFFDANFFEALKKRADYDKIVEKVNIFWGIKILA